MPGCPNREYEAIATTGVEWRQHLDDSLDQSALKQRECEDVGWRRWNGNAALALQRADHFVPGIAQDRREPLGVALDIDGGDELVVSPNLASRTVRHRGGDREIHHVHGWNRVTRRCCQDGQTDFVI